MHIGIDDVMGRTFALPVMVGRKDEPCAIDVGAVSKQFEWMLMRERMVREVPFDGGLNDLNLFLCDLTVNLTVTPTLLVGVQFLPCML